MSRKSHFVDLDNPPASVQLDVGEQIVCIRKRVAGGQILKSLTIPTSHFRPRQILYGGVLTGQPQHTNIVGWGIATATGKGSIGFQLAPPSFPSTVVYLPVSIPFTVK